MKKILIALDYGPTAQQVAEEGFSLAKTMGAEAVLLHVIAEPMYYASEGYSPIMGFTGYMDKGLLEMNSVDALKEASMHFLDKSKQHLGDSTIQTLVEEGEVADAILKAAKDNSINIIVMGSHSRKWLENILMGSVTEKVLHHTSIPLFIVPTKQKNENKN